MGFFKQSVYPGFVAVRGRQIIVSGQGCKVRDWLNPRGLQQADGFVIYDPYGYMYLRYGRLFARGGYRVKTFNAANLRESDRYNPLAYIRRDSDIPKLVSAFITGTKGIGKPGDLRFLSSETLLLSALVGYLIDEALEHERNIGSVIEMLKSMLPEDDDYRYHNDIDRRHAIDFMFEEIEDGTPDCFCVKRYEGFKFNAGSHAGMVAESCAHRLKPFRAPEIRNYFSGDELGLDSLCDGRKTVLFVSGGKSETFGFMVPLMYTQLFDTLCEESGQC